MGKSVVCNFGVGTRWFARLRQTSPTVRRRFAWFKEHPERQSVSRGESAPSTVAIPSPEAELLRFLGARVTEAQGRMRKCDWCDFTRSQPLLATAVPHGRGATPEPPRRSRKAFSRARQVRSCCVEQCRSRSHGEIKKGTREADCRCLRIIYNARNTRSGHPSRSPARQPDLRAEMVFWTGVDRSARLMCLPHEDLPYPQEGISAKGGRMIIGAPSGRFRWNCGPWEALPAGTTVFGRALPRMRRPSNCAGGCVMDGRSLVHSAVETSLDSWSVFIVRRVDLMHIL